MAPIKELIFERTFNAPLETVWQALTDPKMLKEWWGPNDVNIPECLVDLRVGGRVYIVMEAGEGMGPYEGTRWPMEGKYTSVEKNSRLAYEAKGWTEGQEDTTAIEQVTDMTLTEENGKTKMKLKATVNKLGSNAQMAIEGMEMGFNQQFDKLDKLLG